MQDLPMKNEPDSDITLLTGSLIPSDTFIPIKRANIPGGAISSKVAIVISGGGSIISSSQNPSKIAYNRHLSAKRLEDRITVQSE